MKNSAIGSNWKDIRSELFTKEEILESDMRVAIMSELIEARHEQGISQKKLEELSGVSQPVIARMEVDRDEITWLAKIIHRTILPPVRTFSGKYQNYQRITNL